MLRARRAPPRLVGSKLELVEGSFAFDAADNDVEARIGLLDRVGIDCAVLSLQPTLGHERLPAAEHDEIVAAWEDGIVAAVAGAGGRLAALAAGPASDGFAGSCVGSDTLGDDETLETVIESLRLQGGFLFIHPSGGLVPEGLPPWWGALALYTAQMQSAYLIWLADAQDRFQEIPIVFAILAGGGPFQLERLASRGVEVRANLHPNVYFDTASYGPRALELCIQTFGVEQLVYGSDLPVVDPVPTLRAIEGFGESVEKMIRHDTPARLLSGPLPAR